MATVIAVQAAQLFGIGLLIVAGLAFLGFGPAEPEPSWGFMIQDASSTSTTRPWLMVPTGVVLALTVVAANELADAIAGKGADERPASAGAVVVSSRPPATRRRPIPTAVLDVRELTISRRRRSRSWSPASRSPCSPAGCSAWSASPAAARP